MGSARRRHVALIGFMGSGKTTVGQLVAERLGLAFVDTDRLVERMVGLDIPTIFAHEGEAAFRAYETEALQQALQGSPCVIATGGGLVTVEANWDMMASRALTVWLRIGFEVIRRRLQGSVDRPLLHGDPTLQRAHALYQSREPLYRRADVWVDAGQTPIHVAKAVVRTVHVDWQAH